jgi:hypothetical protein
MNAYNPAASYDYGVALALLGWAAFRALRIPTHNG